MPIPPSTLDHQLSNLSTSDETKKETEKEAFEVLVPEQPDVDSNDDDDSSQDSSVHEMDSPKPKFQKTESKIMEEQGLMADEPLLKENPHRFVIFPIQDNDVSLLFVDILRVKYPTCPFTQFPSLSLFIAVGNVQESRSLFLDF